MISHRVFLQWFVMALAYSVLAILTIYAGQLQAIWQTDITYMTSVIGGVFVVACGYLGFASYRYDREIDYTADRTKNGLAFAARINRAIADSALARTAAFVVTLIGLLGTAIGLMFQVKAMGNLDVSNAANVVAFIGTIGKALSTALYATSCGIVACVGITLMNANLEYFIDRDGSE